MWEEFNMVCLLRLKSFHGGHSRDLDGEEDEDSFLSRYWSAIP